METARQGLEPRRAQLRRPRGTGGRNMAENSPSNRLDSDVNWISVLPPAQCGLDVNGHFLQGATMRTNKHTLVAIGAFAALLTLGMATAQAKGVMEAAPPAAVGGNALIDAAIDAALKTQLAAANLTEAGALVYREQLQFQFRSLSAAEQQKILASVREASAPGGIVDVVALLANATKVQAEQAVAETDAAASAQSSGVQPKLGVGSSDRVYISTVGPCRVADSRNGPGKLQPFTGRQLWVLDGSIFGGYSWAADQGGTGTSTTGNCVGSAFGLGTKPDSVVAIVTAVNTVSTGAMQAWNGGTTLNGGAVVVWNPGDRATNTTVIPTNRSIAAFPGSGTKRDIALYNNSGSPVDYVVDVVGYFIVNEATALDCTTLTSASIPIAAGAGISASSPACAAGFTRVVTTCFPAHYAVHLVGTSGNTCFFNNTGGGPSSFTATSVCCRVPGR
ncbi:MAG: hypothetical protein IT521_10545 [Burkholderiales bacterium]|nr:hypothetical protein [Burkholderiales bacterium]